jgi:STAS-like domain of unknown function (DUF4325)
MNQVTIKITKVVDGGICVAAADGNRVHDAIVAEMEKGNRIELSFSGVTRMTTAFLNTAIGQLYGEFSEEQIRKHLAPPIDVQSWHLNRLKLVVDRAKIFFKNPSAAKDAFLSSTGLEDD